LTDLYTQGHNPDVLTCLANLSNDEVFTPPVIANKMLDLLPQELFSDPNSKFLDPAVKSGVFLREIVKRLNEGLKDKIPDLQTRIDHILHNQVFGIAITEMTSLLSRRSVYCSKYPNGKYSISLFDTAEGNIRYKRLLHVFKNGKCGYCGASEEQYNRDEDLESHAYELIHTTKPEAIFNMKFDVIIGNPPYQLSDGGFGVSAKPIYQKFVHQAKKLSPRFLVMITPSRWFAGGKGLEDYRKEMLADKHLRVLVDYENAMECFPGVDLAGGVSYFLWDRDHKGTCMVTNIVNGEEYTAERKLDEFDIFVRNSKSISIIHKAMQFNEESMATQVSSRKPFGLQTNERPKDYGDLVLKWQNGEGKYPREDLKTGLDLIDKWNVISAKTAYDHAGSPGKDGKRKVFTKLHILPPGTICTETYIVVGSFDKIDEAENLRQYMQTMFFRFLVSQFMFSQDITKDRFAFVPIQDFTEPWTDEKLYEKYGLTEEEIAFIESMIRPMDLSGGSDE
jgi:site-specific DNA-methyltransferase (adenine-specific)